MRIALVQANPVIGDFSGNVQAVLRGLEAAREAGCCLAVFPELFLCGYPPQDLLERPAFIQAHDRALEEVTARTGDTALLLGALERNPGAGKPLFNSALFIHQGRVLHRVRKRLLPTYDVFDERRWFEPGEPGLPVRFQGLDLGITVCEDIWAGALPGYHADPAADLAAAGARVLVNISASPYHFRKPGQRETVFSRLCQRHGLPLVHVNQVGGQDSLVFDGLSQCLDPQGRVRARARAFAPDILVVDTATWAADTGPEPLPHDLEALRRALVLGVRDYFGKLGFTRALLGLSGGIDSALTCALACEALGAENVLGVALPSPHTSRASVDDARALAGNLGCGFNVLPIEEMMEAAARGLEPLCGPLGTEVTGQNVQARIRGLLLMAISNHSGRLLLSTGNKSELAVGYCTLYGDMNGGLAVISDVPKTLVYALARHVNAHPGPGRVPPIPERSITRPPTAELAPDQRDQDDLPPYEVLDAILELYLEHCLSLEEIAARGFDRATVDDVAARIRRNEYKRKQAALGLKMTGKAFGFGRRYPTVHRFDG